MRRYRVELFLRCRYMGENEAQTINVTYDVPAWDETQAARIATALLNHPTYLLLDQHVNVQQVTRMNPVSIE